MLDFRLLFFEEERDYIEQVLVTFAEKFGLQGPRWREESIMEMARRMFEEIDDA